MIFFKGPCFHGRCFPSSVLLWEPTRKNATRAAQSERAQVPVFYVGTFCFSPEPCAAQGLSQDAQVDSKVCFVVQPVCGWDLTTGISHQAPGHVGSPDLSTAHALGMPHTTISHPDTVQFHSQSWTPLWPPGGRLLHWRVHIWLRVGKGSAICWTGMDKAPLSRGD